MHIQRSSQTISQGLMKIEFEVVVWEKISVKFVNKHNQTKRKWKRN